MRYAEVGQVLDALPLAVLILDEAGMILVANVEAGRILERDPASLIGTALFESIAEVPDRVASGALDGLFHASTRPRSGVDAAALRVHARPFKSADGPNAAVALIELRGTGDGSARLVRAAEITTDVKHDVNNLLMGLLGHVALLGGRTDLSDAALRKVAVVEQLGAKIRDRIADLESVRLLAEIKK